MHSPRMLTNQRLRLIIVQPMRLYQIISIFFIVVTTTGCEPEPQSNAVLSPVDTSLCQFVQGACVKTLSQSTLSMFLSPENAPSETPLTIDIYSDTPLNAVTVRLEGRDMFMGLIPVKMHQIDKKHYQGTLVFGSCSSGYMVWRTFVQATTDSQEINTVFDFLADSPH